jgi:PAS domain S-box-containing protein
MKNRSDDTVLSDLLLSKEESYELVFNNLDIGFALVAKDFRVIALNELSRKKIHEKMGIKVTNSTMLFDLFPIVDRKEITEIFEAVLKGETRVLEISYSTEGNSYYYENQFSPARNSSNEIVCILISSKDVTEIKRTNLALKEVEERWRFALEGGNQGVWDWNMKTGEVFYSDAYKRLYGFDVNELKGTIGEWQNLIHPDDKKRMDRAVEEHTSSPDPYYESTYRIRAKDGSYRWVLARGMIVSKDEKGAPFRMIGTHTDITKQITAEQTYKMLFYSNPLPMWTYNLKTLRFLTVNDAAIAHYGYSKEEFLSMTIADIRPKEDVAQLLELIKNRSKHGYLKSLTRHVKKDGQIIFVEVSTNQLEGSDNNAMLVVAHDITSKVKAEEEITKSNERFVLSSRATSDAIYDWDLVTNELHWGEGLQALFGFEPKEVPVTLWENLVHPDDRNHVHTGISKALNDPETEFWKEEYRFAKADGRFSFVFDRGFIIRDQNKRAIRMIGSMQDITERKYSEQILSLERLVLELSNNPDIDFRYIVETLLKGIEEIHDDAFTSLLVLQGDGAVQPFVAPRLPAGFTEKLRGLKLGPNDGSCGAAMHKKETVIVKDISTDPLWKDYKTLALQFNLKACWSLPVINSSGKTMGSFAIYYKEIKNPSPSELSTLERVRNILRILMEHHWSLNEIKRANERFDVIIRATHDLIWDWDLETDTIYRDQLGLQKVYGIDDNKSIEKIEQWLSHIHPDDLGKAQNVISQILQAKEEDTFDWEYRFRKNDGTYSYVYDRGMIIRDNNGKAVRMIGAAQDVTERKLLEQELLQNELEKQKAINQATVDSQEQERTEIGKELHDNVNQILTTTKLYLDLALSNSELKDDLILKSNRNIISVINEIRQLSRSLMDPTIGDLGLIESINDLVENINLTKKIHVKLEADKRLEAFLDKSHKLTVFRIIQEALNNTIKHALATTVAIRFKLRGSHAEISIRDDGTGFDPLLVKMGAGLKNIQNRVYLVNGSYSIHTAPKQGCKIIIKFPINK